MKIVLELKNKPVKGDLLVLDDNGTAKCVSQVTLFKPLTDRITQLEELIASLMDRITQLESDISVLKGENE